MAWRTKEELQSKLEHVIKRFPLPHCSRVQKVATPLILREWIEELKDHPDAEFRGYFLNGIKNGFRIGFNRAVTCKPASSNMHSALENVGIVQEYLKKEVSLGRILEPVPPERVPVSTQLSPCGATLKRLT